MLKQVGERYHARSNDAPLKCPEDGTELPPDLSEDVSPWDVYEQEITCPACGKTWKVESDEDWDSYPYYWLTGEEA